MTYLMFIHDLDAADNQRAKESAMLGLPHKSIFSGEVQVGGADHSGQSAQMVSVPRFSRRTDVFRHAGVGVPLHQEPPRRQGQCLRQVYGGTPFSRSHASDAGQDRHRHGRDLRPGGADPRRRCRGDIYEYLLSKIATAGVNGQFRPRHIIRMMVDMMAPGRMM